MEARYGILSGKLNFTENNWTLDYSSVDFDNPPQYLPFQFEVHDWRKWASFISINWHIAVLTGIFYLVTIYVLKAFMSTRKAFDLRRELCIWNAFLGLFSIAGFLRTAPELISILKSDRGLFKSLCVMSGANMPLSFWAFMFAISKFLELGDTVFLILRKKAVEPVQWYHHLVTLMFTWITGPLIEPISRYYLVMNYGVHSLMYPYFAAKAWGLSIPRWVSNVITSCQLLQMLIGFGVNMYTAYLLLSGVSCTRYLISIQLSFFVYGSFVLLFGKLFMDVIQKTNKVKTA